MGRKPSYKPLNVFLNVRHVGQLLRERNGAISFTYDQSWLNWEHRLPISLSLPLQEGRYVGAQGIDALMHLAFYPRLGGIASVLCNFYLRGLRRKH